MQMYYRGEATSAECNQRVGQAGNAVNGYIEETGGVIILSLIAHGAGGKTPGWLGGRLGGATHRQIVEEIEQYLKSQNYELVRAEWYVKMGWRARGRLADVAGRNPATGQWELYQVGDLAADGTPVLREADALADLRRKGYTVYFVPKNLR